MVNNIMEGRDKRKLQQVILFVAKEVVRICDKHNIEYHLSGGSMLGAVRHNGFIPWDDDFDIGMKRVEFERFLQVCESELDKNRFFLQTEKSEKNFCFSFAKIRLAGTHFIEDFSQNADVNDGIFVDIFPYDNLPDETWKRIWFLLRNQILKNMIWVKCGYGEIQQMKSLKYKLFKILGYPFSVETMKRKRYALITKNNIRQTEMCFTSDYSKQAIRNSWLNVSVYYTFESERFKGVEKYDDYLKALYGDYMKLPDEQDRVIHSHYEVDFGPYENLFCRKED